VPSADPPTPTRITVADLAAHKRLPVEFLAGRSVGLDNNALGEVVIPYLAARRNQRALLNRYRTALRAKDGTMSATGRRLAPYGVWRLDEAREAGYLVIAEGESTPWTLWYYHIPALGIPGAGAAGQCLRRLQPGGKDHIDGTTLDGILTVYLCRDPDTAGEGFVEDAVATLREIDFTGRVLVLDVQAVCGCKDASDLHCRDPQAFVAERARVVAAAQPPAPPAAPPPGAARPRRPSRLSGHATGRAGAPAGPSTTPARPRPPPPRRSPSWPPLSRPPPQRPPRPCLNPCAVRPEAAAAAGGPPNSPAEPPRVRSRLARDRLTRCHCRPATPNASGAARSAPPCYPLRSAACGRRSGAGAATRASATAAAAASGGSPPKRRPT
jgi:hypothetical protein